MASSEWVDDGDRESDSERGGYAKRGLPGKLASARNHAPTGASEEEIQDVAKEAFEDDKSVCKVWLDRTQHTLEEF